MNLFEDFEQPNIAEPFVKTSEPVVENADDSFFGAPQTGAEETKPATEDPFADIKEEKFELTPENNKPTNAMPDGEFEVTGYVKNINFRNEDNGFTVFRMSLEEPIGNGITRIVVVCNTPRIEKDEYVAVVGSINVHPTFGTQIKAVSVRPIIPHTIQGIESLLKSKFLPITETVAKAMVKKFGLDTFDIIEHDPIQLLGIKGIVRMHEKKRRQRNNIYENILETYQQKIKIRDIIEFCTSYGMGIGIATKVHNVLGDNAINVIKANPYSLTQIRGIAFRTADKIAQNFGLAFDDPKRIDAGVRYVLMEEAAGNGTCGLPDAELYKKAKDFLEVPDLLCVEAAKRLVERGEIVEEERATSYFYAPNSYYTEAKIATCLKRIKAGKRLFSLEKIDSVLADAEEMTNIKLDEIQRAALKRTLENKVSVITGGPGVGKTTIINTLCKACRSMKICTCLSAPTGRAAKRMEEQTGEHAKTIHRLLVPSGKDGGGFAFKFTHENPLPAQFYIVDETSMVDIFIMNALLDAIPSTSHIVFVGDVDQLPSVGVGQVLADMINSGEIAVTRLTKIFRQAQSSKIIQNAHFVNASKMPDLQNDIKNDFFFVPAETPEDCLRKIETMIHVNIPNRFGFSDAKDIQVLSPMKNGTVGTISLNANLQFLMNQNVPVYFKQKELSEKMFSGLTKEDKLFLEKYPDDIPAYLQKFGKMSRLLCIGDKVMQIKNNYEKKVFNGDVGYITDVYDGELTVEFENETVDYKFSEVNQLALAYACTIHKSQGSEYPVVIIPVMKQHFVMLQKKILYTGITRGKKLVVLVGQREAIRIAACWKQKEQVRYTKLKDFLKGEKPVKLRKSEEEQEMDEIWELS